ncbi:MAG: hypothetical protein GY913_10095 [Proteobacteria bacterium]|nr:hypothetical protein [Pseudomonadota bacterium]MCP4917264.1 hypothetical protein [Pseudomonadota bacterium]
MLFLFLACRPVTEPDEEVEVPAPWDDLDAVELDPGRHLLDAPIDGPLDPVRIELVDPWPIALVLDVDRIHVFDARWHQSGKSFCLDAADYPYAIDDRSGRCDSAEVELSRGVWVLDAAPLDVTWDDELVWIIDDDGGLYTAVVDPRVENPWDHLRLERIDVLVPGPIDAFEGEIWHAAGTTLTVGTVQHELPAPALAVEDGVVLTTAGLWTVDGGLIELDSPGELSGGWATHADGITHVDGERHDVDAQAIAASGGHLVALTNDGLWTPDGIQADVAGRDVSVRGAEIAVLTDIDVAVRFDESRLAGDVGLWVAAFAEQPRSPSEDAECDRVAEFVERGVQNRELLDDLPATVALGVTPHLARRTKGCALRTEFEPVWDADATEVGVLFHQEPEHCTDADCASSFLAEEYAVVQELGAEPGFVSGLSPSTELGLDWRALLSDANISKPFMFNGMSVLEDVPHHVDPRAKDPWPQARDELTASWTVDDQVHLAGDNVPAFSLSGCPNLFVRECQALGQGGGQILDADDIVVLDLLLHRALDTGQGTWSFHLPDVGSWDYTDGCQATDRVWQGECGGAPLQEWLFDVHLRFVDNGVARWSTPGEEAP